MVLETILFAVGISSVVSYETTGKGLADHTISAVSGKDCKIARVVHNEQVCQKEPVATVTVASTTAVPERASASNGGIARANDVFAERARKSNESNKTR